MIKEIHSLKTSLKMHMKKRINNYNEVGRTKIILGKGNLRTNINCKPRPQKRNLKENRNVMECLW